MRADESRLCGSLDTGQQNRKLVAAQAGDDAAVPDGAQEPGSDFLEQSISRRMAEGVIDGLEPIEVEDRQSERSPARVAADLLVERGDEGAPIGETCQEIGCGRNDRLVMNMLSASLQPVAGSRPPAGARSLKLVALHYSPVFD